MYEIEDSEPEMDLTRGWVWKDSKHWETVRNFHKNFMR